MNSATTLVVALMVLAAGVSAYLAVAWARRGPADTLLVAALRLLVDLYMRVYHRLRFTPRDHAIPVEGPAIVAANHRSSVDPLALASCTKRVVHFLMAREYYEQRGLRWFFRLACAIPVNRDGRDLGATKAALRALAEGHVVGIFPEGGIRGEGGEERVAKSGAALLALKTGVPVVPAHIAGTPASDSVFRALLVPSRSSVRFGDPLRLEPSSGRKPTREEIDSAARQIIERINALGSAPFFPATGSRRVQKARAKNGR